MYNRAEGAFAAAKDAAKRRLVPEHALGSLEEIGFQAHAVADKRTGQVFFSPENREVMDGLIAREVMNVVQGISDGTYSLETDGVDYYDDGTDDGTYDDGSY